MNDEPSYKDCILAAISVMYWADEVTDLSQSNKIFKENRFLVETFKDDDDRMLDITFEYVDSRGKGKLRELKVSYDEFKEACGELGIQSPILL